MELESRILIDKLKALHYRMKGLLDNKDFEGVKKLLIEYTDDSKDVNEMKTLLIITKDFKLHITISWARTKLSLKLKDKLAILQSQPKAYYNGVEVKEGKKGDLI